MKEECKMNIFNEIQGVYSGVIADISNVYVKDGYITKNRDDRNIIIQDEINNFRNIVIEQDGMIDIYCSEEKSRLYIKEIKYLKQIYSGIEKYITIHIERSK
jgi:hypothetical protein